MAKRFFIITLLAAALVSAVPASAAMPASGELSEEQLGQISQNCGRVQAALRGVQKRDTVLRINRGRLYDMTLRQTGAFVTRITTHKIDAPKVKELDSAIRAQFQQFLTDYDRYGDSLTAVIGMKCGDKPHEFYEALAKAADDRRAIAEDVAAIKQYIADYTSELSVLRDKMKEEAAQ